MKPLRYIKAVISLLTLLSLFGAGFASSAELRCFSLTSAETSAGRLFETVLTAENIESLASFCARISFDDSKLEFQSAAAENKASVLSTNAKEKGRLTVVFLNSEGISCTNATPLLRLKFKALSTGSTRIYLSVSDAIGNSFEDISYFECKGAEISISAKAVAQQNSKAFSDETVIDEAFGETASLTEVKESKGYLRLSGSGNPALVISVSLTVAAVFILSMFGAYRLGKSRSKK
ncbi:MAG: cohesin domain-containing protein [Ruminococcus sp.]